jgi:hypothetical protein
MKFPWMINGTAGNNIIFDKSQLFSHVRYEKVLDVCQLRTDLSDFQNYDQSEIEYQLFTWPESLAKACTRKEFVNPMLIFCFALIFDNVFQINEGNRCIESTYCIL